MEGDCNGSSNNEHGFGKDNLGTGFAGRSSWGVEIRLVWDFTPEGTENTEALLPYLRVSNHDLRGLRALRGWNSSIHQPRPAPFTVPTEKRNLDLSWLDLPDLLCKAFAENWESAGAGLCKGDAIPFPIFAGIVVPMPPGSQQAALPKATAVAVAVHGLRLSEAFSGARSRR